MKIGLWVFGFASLLSLSFAEPGKTHGPPAPLMLEMDSTSHKYKTWDYGLPYTTFTHKTAKLSEMKGKKMLVFYFSATCPHCQEAIPHILEIAQKEKDSVKTIAIAAGNNTPENLGEFISKYKVNIPVFKDDKRSFSDNYGTGRVPVILMVNGKGNYVRLTDFHGPESAAQVISGFHDSKLF